MQQVYSSAPYQSVETHKVLRNTYSLLAVTLLVSALASGIGMAIGLPPVAGIVCSLAAMGLLWFVLPRLANSPKGIGVVFAVAALLGIGLAPTLQYYLQTANGGSIIMQALGGTALVFFGLSGYVLTTKKDFSFMGGFLLVGLVVVLIAAIANIFFQVPAVSLAISAAIVFIMSGFILFDTSRIVNGGETNYIRATVGLYLNIYNLFTSLLHLLGAFNSDD